VGGNAANGFLAAGEALYAARPCVTSEAGLVITRFAYAESYSSSAKVVSRIRYTFLFAYSSQNLQLFSASTKVNLQVSVTET